MRCVALAVRLTPKMMPCDVQAYQRAARGVRALEVDLAILAWKEPWAVADFGGRVQSAMAAAPPGDGCARRLLCDAMAAFLRARDGVTRSKLPKQAFEQRRILARQRGLCHIGFPATARNFGFLRRLKAAGATSPCRTRVAKCQRTVTLFRATVRIGHPTPRLRIFLRGRR